MARVPMSERTRNELKDMFAGKRGADRSGLVHGARGEVRIALTNFQQRTDLTTLQEDT